MDAKLNQSFSAVATSRNQEFSNDSERRIVSYWLLVTVPGVVLLWDWLTVWNVPTTMSNLPMALYLLLTFALSQVLYALVARYDGRPFYPGAAAVFAVGNGVAETLAFALVYRAGEVLIGGLVGLFAPAAASVAGFVGGVALFVVYGGLIHGLFWLHVLPPHLDEAPRSRQIRKFRPIAEIALVLGWSLCFWLTRDIWTVVLLHILVDIGLMIKVRPPLFGAG